VPFVNQAPPVDPLTANALTADYERCSRSATSTRRREQGEGAGGGAAENRVGPVGVNGGALMRHPPERYYPQVDGSYDWMKRDLEASITASRLGAGT
jgi:hypothetical protein